MNLYNGNGNGNGKTPNAPSNGENPERGRVTVSSASKTNWQENYKSSGDAFDQGVILRQPRTWSRGIVWSLVGVTTIVVAWACLAETEEAVPAQGKLEPEGQVAEVQVPVNGVVSQLLVKDGERVNKDDVLLKLDPTVTKSKEKSQREIRKALIAENNYYESQLADAPISAVPASLSPEQLALTHDREALAAENQVYRLQLAGASSGRGLTAEEQARLTSGVNEIDSRINTAQLDVTQRQRQLDQASIQLAGQQQQLNVDEGILVNLTELYQQGGIAQLQYLQQQQKVMDRRAEVNRLAQEEARLKAAIAQGGEQVRNTVSVAESELFTRIAANDKRIAELDSQISKQIADNKRQISTIDSELSQTTQTISYQDVKAPIAGKIFDLQAKAPGFVTTNTEPVLKIVPDDALVATVYITNRDIGFVKEGMDVDVRIESFPFSEFGDIKGKLVWIGSDALPPDDIYKFYRFPAKVKLDKQFIEANGRPINLQSGMSVTVNIKVRKRKVIEIFTNLFGTKVDSLKNVR